MTDATDLSELTCPIARRKEARHFMLVDHHLIRLRWWNLHEIAPGVWRSNQPCAHRLRHYKDLGIRTIVTFRGQKAISYNRIEKRACKELGLNFTYVPGLAARELRSGDAYLDVVEKLRQVDGPFLMHCKSGADRTGLASALYLILVKGADVRETALTQLCRKRIHFRGSRAGVLSHLFHVYLRDAEPRGIDFRTWLKTGYDPEAVTEDFQHWRSTQKWGRYDHRAYWGTQGEQRRPG